MYRHYTFLVLMASSCISALPLNINLGAFSPALVVGDGEISFGGEADVSQLMTALSGASQEASASSTAEIQRAGVEAASKDAPTVIPTLPIVESESSASPTPSPNGSPLVLGIGKSIEPRLPEAGADTMAVENKKRSVGEEGTEVKGRDLAGFNAALAFATGALKTGPEVQLGTGEGGSGVGIIVKAGSENGGAATTEKIGKRDQDSFPTVTMLKLRTIGSPIALESTERSVKSRAVADDGVNVNLSGNGEEYELTIAEIKG